MKLICKICGKEIEHPKDAYAIRDFLSHLREAHKMKKEEYLVKYECNGVHPTCACGCGNPVKPEKGWNKWRKYYKDHKNHMKVPQELVLAISERMKKRYKGRDYDVMTEEEIKESLDRFKNGETLMKLSEDYGHDKRTLKSMWIKYGLISEIEYSRFAEHNQKVLSGATRADNSRQSIEYYETVHEFILKNKFKYNIHEINALFGNKPTDTTLMKNLLNLFDDGFEDYLILGVKSKEEVQYLDILRFFFGASNVKYGIKIGGRIFDALIFKKVLLEYDGSYYHSSEKSKDNDALKDKIAKENGYILIRVNEKTAKDIEILKKIKEYGKIYSSENSFDNETDVNGTKEGL